MKTEALIVGEYTIAKLRAGEEVTVSGVTLIPADDLSNNIGGEQSGDVRKSETPQGVVGAQMPRDGSIPSAPGRDPVWQALVDLTLAVGNHHDAMIATGDLHTPFARAAEALLKYGPREGQVSGIPGPNYRQLIEEHNQGCDASCKAQRPSDLSGSSTGCGYQRMDGTLIYNSRRCPNCPQDWKIELPLPATNETTTKG